MMSIWTHAAPSALAAFLASLVEFVEALTVVLAVGAVRGWRWALAGAGAGLLLLAALVLAFGPLLGRLPLAPLQLGFGVLTLLFGLRWLRKAVLRAAGRIPLHDEAALFATRTGQLRGLDRAAGGWDPVAFAASFQITLIEGMEVVFIIVAFAAGAPGTLPAAAVGALAALVAVVLAGALLHRPIATIPENLLKFAVGVLLTAFGTFWVGEGLGLPWPGDDAAIPLLVAGFLAVAMAATRGCRDRRAVVS